MVTNKLKPLSCYNYSFHSGHRTMTKMTRQKNYSVIFIIDNNLKIYGFLSVNEKYFVFTHGQCCNLMLIMESNNFWIYFVYVKFYMTSIEHNFHPFQIKRIDAMF